MAKDNFVSSPMDYEAPPSTIKPPGKYGGDPAFPQRSAFGTGVPEKVYETWPTEKSEAMGSPVINDDTVK